ncbi:MAG: HAMP domain-containing protein, partial [Myxococcales bacterium]
MEDLLSEHGEQFDQPMPVAISRERGEIHPEIERIALALEAAADGELRARLPTAGILAPIAIAANRLISQNARFMREITRVSRRVSSDGRLSERAHVSVVSGAYEEALSGLNDLLDQLTWHAGETGAVARALEQGELGRTMPLEWPDGTPLRGQALRVARSMNALVARLGGIRSEVIRIAGEVGTAGRLGGQAEVRGASGAWEELISAVNLLAANLTSQVRNIALVTTAVARGDLSRKITVPAQGEILELKETVNEMVDQLRAFAAEVTRVAREVGTEGRLGGQADVKGVSGTWKDLTDSVNVLAGNLTDQVRNIAKVTTAVANGDLSQKITVDVRGEILALKNTINTMVDQLRSFASEVTRVAKQVGTEGQLGAQAEVPGVSGVWKDLTDNVNVLAGNLTNQVRGISKVVTAVANGDLTQKFSLAAKGEIAALADTINGMTDTLRIFAEQVVTVAREVGIEGKLGGQAKVPGAAGTWKGLTENVNQLAANLTTQVRAIAEVATAVTQGDL